MKFNHRFYFFRFTFSFCLAVAFSKACLSQNKDVPGYYVTLNSDTVRGNFHNYGNGDFSPNQFEFLQQASTEKITLTPDNCKSLHIEGYDDYVSFTGKRLTNPASFGAAINDPDSSKKYEDTKVFLRILFSNGTFYLLEYKDKLRSNYYVQKKNEPAIELLFYQYNDLSGSVAERNIFRVQLQGILADFISSQRQMDDLEKLAYDDDQLVSFFSKITGPDRNTQKTGRHTQYFITAGMNVTSVQNDALNYKLSTSAQPFAGVGFIDYGRRNFGRSFFSIALKVFRINSSTGTTAYLKSWVPGVYCSPGYYIIHKEKLSWYGSLAIGGVLAFNQYEVHKRYSAVIKISNEKKVNFIVAPETGISFKEKIDLFVNYYLSPKYVSGYSFKLSTWGVGLNYRLYK